MKKAVITLVGFCAAICGCQHEYSEEMDRSSRVQDISLQEIVKKEALDFVKDIAIDTRNSQKTVSSVYPWRSCDIFTSTRSDETVAFLPDTLLYIVNFANEGGYALVSSTSISHEVVAYVEEGNLTPTEPIDHPGLRMFLEGYGNMQLPDSMYHPIQPDTNQVTPNPFYYEPKWKNTKVVYPLLHTKWGQEAPFSRYCLTSNNEQSVAGCSPIAAAQIVAFHQSPSCYNGHTYDWSEIGSGKMPTTSLGQDMAAHLIRDIGELMQVRYETGRAWLINPMDIDYCWNGFNYSYTYGDYDYDNCVSSLKSGSPVLITGVDSLHSSAHTWVIDGSMTRIAYDDILLANGEIGTIIYAKTNLVHCNWGFYGKGDGYFISGAFKPSNRHSKYIWDTDGTSNNSNSYTWHNKAYYCVHPN